MRLHVPSPRIAVVIPSYNDGEFLHDTIASLTAQETHELVLVNDGSTDPLTVKVLSELESAGIRVLHQPNQGVSAARMAGVRATSAPYIFPLDGDDKVAPGALKALADALEADPDAVLAWGDVVFFGMGQSALRLPTPKHLDPWYITYVNEIPEASLIRRTALLATPGWQLTLGYEDWDLWLSLAGQGGKGVRVSTVAEMHRLHAPRRMAYLFTHHHQLEEDLRERHADLFRHRSVNRRRSPSPLRLRLLVPLIERLGLSSEARLRLIFLLSHPVRLPTLWMLRLRWRLQQSRGGTPPPTSPG
jgi:glycosyltransferase involved in cell wall biosynthesis